MNNFALEQLPNPVNFDPFADGDIVLAAPATAAQKEIWASVKMGDDANCAYNESVTIRLQGELNVKLLTAALNLLVERHESLRTTLSPDGNTLCINSPAQFEIQPIDLSNLTPLAQTEKIAEIKHQSVITPFDLQHDALFRVELLKLHDREHQLVLSAHHIICDGWSWGVIITDLGKLYAGLKSGAGADLDPVDVFSDYAQELESEASIAAEREITAYWLQQFSGAIPVLDLPTDYPRPALRTFEADRQDYELSTAVVAGLKQLSTASGCSFMTVLIASFEILLYRITGQDDLVVGVPTAGQLTAEQYNLVGHCVNLLPLRTQIAGDRSFQDYLSSRSSAILDAYDRQPFTFGSLLSGLVLPRDASRIPLVSAVLNIDRGLESDRLDYADLDVSYVSNPRRYENFELYINVTEFKAKTILEWQYNTNLFDAATIDRRMAEFETLLAGIIANPQQQIDFLPLLPQSQRQTIEQWSQIAVTQPATLCLHQLFEAQVIKTPDAVAIACEGRSLTYNQLNHRANQLAHYLQTLGVGADVLVGICVERSIETIVGILGILKAGGGYLPLDPSNPQQRLEYILQDAKVKILVTESSSSEKLTGCQVTICLDTDLHIIDTYPTANLAHRGQPDNLAYVIYTSGSTGQPKGVAVNHGNVVRLFTTTADWYRFTDRDVWPLFHSCAFDFSVWEMWGALLYGGRVVVVPYIVSRDPSAFYQLLVTERVTILNQTPSAFYQLMQVDEQLHLNTPLGVRLVFLGGEALNFASLAPWFDRHGDTLPQLVNMYGITETTVHVTYRPISSADVRSTKSNSSLSSLTSSIGRPLPDLQVYLLDSHLQPVPIGVSGEMYVGGAGVARGYWQRDALTAERFIPHPFSPDAGARLYKTGDLARYLPDGNIEYLGRIDGQVNLRGFRIELGEIEATIGQCGEIRETVAIVREDIPGDRRIVAYVVPTALDRDGTVTQLRALLKQKLPEYMVPNAFVVMDALPLTANGKVDRRALPIPDASRRDLAASYVAPTNPMETQIVQIWSEILKLDKIGIHDNFFESGGYSLLGIQVISRLRQSFGIDLALRVLFELPTVSELANRIATLQWAQQSLANTTATATSDFEEGEL
jgi:amino acid adenylation domain-containing protein